MRIEDYDAVVELMQSTPGVTFKEADSREATARYLRRNPGLSFVALDGSTVVGCLMAGHDGRRGYLQHLAVLPSHRRQGVATALVSRCLAELEQLGILKSHIDVIRDNEAGRAYWERHGWTLWEDIFRLSYVAHGRQDA